MKKQSSKKVGHLSSMINTVSAVGGEEGSDSCNLDGNISISVADVNNEQQFRGGIAETSSIKVSTSCEQNNVDNITTGFNSVSILESSSKMQQHPMNNSSGLISNNLSTSLPPPRAPFLSSRPITSQDKLNNIPEVKLPSSVISSNDAIPYGSLRDSTSQSYSIGGGIGGRRDKWLGPKSWHPNNNRFGNNNNNDNDDDAPSEIPQSLTALKVMTQITSEQQKRGESVSIEEQTEKEGSDDEDDSCQFDLELDS